MSEWGYSTLAHPWAFNDSADIAVMVSGNAMTHLYLNLDQRARPWWPTLGERWNDLAERLLGAVGIVVRVGEASLDAVTIPELGTQQAALPPVTVLTSNRTRDLHDALKRRCLYHWIAYPDTARVAEIVRRRVPASGERLSGQIATAVGRLRSLDLTKPPGISEAISWAFAVSVFGAAELHSNFGTLKGHATSQ